MLDPTCRLLIAELPPPNQHHAPGRVSGTLVTLQTDVPRLDCQKDVEFFRPPLHETESFRP